MYDVCLILIAKDKLSLVKKYLSSNQPLERWNVQGYAESHCTESWFEEMAFEHLISSCSSWTLPFLRFIERAEPSGEKRKSRITCMRMLRTPPLPVYMVELKCF